MLFCVFFFFSSRRRHTRCGRDWSSDVCSSDLPAAPSWARAGGFYERPRHRSGQRLHYARTSNVLIAAQVFEGRAEPFSARYRHGGEDTHFFMRAHLEGHAIVWADDARVTESFPDDRVRLGWL